MAGSAPLMFNLELTPAQVIEVWNTPTHAAGIKLLARIASLPDYDDDPRATIWVEFMYQTLLYGKENKLTPSKTLTFFTAVNTTHDATIECTEDGSMTRQSCLRFFADQLLAGIKAMAPADRFTAAEVKGTTDFFSSTYVPTIKLQQYVYTREQVERKSESEVFVHTPAVPLALSSGLDAASMVPAEAPAVEAPAEAPAEVPAAEPPAVEAAAPAVEPPPPIENEALLNAIKANVDAQCAVLKAKMDAEYAAQEKLLLDRIAALESKLTK